MVQATGSPSLPLSVGTPPVYVFSPVLRAVGRLLAVLVPVSWPSVAAVFHALIRFRQL